MSSRALGWAALAALLGTASATTATADILIDDFERVNAPSPWRFGNGPEFPGATGSLSAGTGHFGKGAHLGYDLSQGGHYVNASLTLTSPLTAEALGFWVRSPANITIVLRVVDASGQTLQYNLRRPMGNFDITAWYRQVVVLSAPGSWWGGLNDGHVHFPFSSISILAADPPMAGAVGSIDFDDVVALNLSPFELDPAGLPLAPAPPGSAEVLSRLGVNIHFTSDSRALDAVVAAGMSWIRMDLTWSAVEKTAGVYNWSAYDTLINALDARGLRALLILDYGNSLYSGSGLPPTTPEAITAFGNYAEAAARHFAGHRVCFEIWNEPNIAGFWAPAPDAAQYAALAREAVRRVHQGDPAATVLTGGLASFDFPFADTALSLGAGTNANAVGVHPYDCSPPEKLSDKLLVFRDLVARRLTNTVPVWDTEWGFTSTAYGDGHSDAARKRQAVMVSRELLCASAAGFPLIIYYDIRDDGTNAADREHNFGLLARDYSDKPAMQAVKTLASVVRGRRLSGFVPAVPSTLCLLRFDGRTNLIVAAWSSAGNGPLTVTVPTNTTAIDFLGTPVTLEPSSNRLAWTLYETNGPVYFLFPGTWQATNLAPVLQPIPDQAVPAGATVRFTNTVDNTENLQLPLSFNLLTSPPPPAGAFLEPTTGLFSWRPVLTNANRSYTLGVVVADAGYPNLCTTQSFSINVRMPVQPAFSDTTVSNGLFSSYLSGDSGPDYSFWFSSNLVDWAFLSTRTSAAPPFRFWTPVPPGAGAQFFRAQLGP